MSDEVDDVVFTWGYSIVTYVTGGFLGIQPILNLSKSWKVPSEFKILNLGSRCFDLIMRKIGRKFLIKDPIQFLVGPLS